MKMETILCNLQVTISTFIVAIDRPEDVDETHLSDTLECEFNEADVLGFMLSENSALIAFTSEAIKADTLERGEITLNGLDCRIIDRNAD